MANLGLCRAQQADLVESTTLLREALAALRGIKGSAGRSQTHAMAGSLAELLQVQGCHSEAEALYREALEGRRKTLGDRHPATRKVAEALVATLAETGPRRGGDVARARG
eukprot:4509555-Prymnesium_polylepis.1